MSNSSSFKGTFLSLTISNILFFLIFSGVDKHCAEFEDTVTTIQWWFRKSFKETVHCSHILCFRQKKKETTVLSVGFQAKYSRLVIFDKMPYHTHHIIENLFSRLKNLLMALRFQVTHFQQNVFTNKHGLICQFKTIP